MMLNLTSPDRKIHAGVILTKGITELMDVAPFEFFAWLDKATLEMLNLPPEMVDESIDVELHWVTEDGGPAKMKSGALIQPTDSFESCPPLDIALMGAHNMGYHISDAEKAFIYKTFESCAAFLTICGGIFALLETGLLQGKTASAPRVALQTLKKTVPVVNWVDKRWVRDGKLWSSSSLLNGTDLIRGFAEETWGGRGMIEILLNSGHYPVRDVDFKDFHGKEATVEQFS